MPEHATALVSDPFDLPGDAAFGELDRVKLFADAVGEEACVPVGTVGTVVAVWNRGSAFEVEFSQPETLATVEASRLRLVSRAAR